MQMEICGWEPRKRREKDEDERKDTVKNKLSGAASK